MKTVLAILCAAALCALAGCTVLKESSVRYSDAPALPPRSGWVVVTRIEPWRPYQALGEIVLESYVNPPVGTEALERKLQAGAAALGADAVLVTFDRVLPVADGATNAYATQRGDPDWKRRLVGMAIKYRE